MTPYGMFTMNVRFITCVNGPRRTRKNPRGTQMLDAGVLLCPRARFYLAARVSLQTPPASDTTESVSPPAYLTSMQHRISRGRSRLNGCLTREAFGGRRGPPKSCTGTQQNTRVPHLCATREYFLRVLHGPLARMCYLIMHHCMVCV